MRPHVVLRAVKCDSDRFDRKPLLTGGGGYCAFSTLRRINSSCVRRKKTFFFFNTLRNNDAEITDATDLSNSIDTRGTRPPVTIGRECFEKFVEILPNAVCFVIKVQQVCCTRVAHVEQIFYLYRPRKCVWYYFEKRLRAYVYAYVPMSVIPV